MKTNIYRLGIFTLLTLLIVSCTSSDEDLTGDYIAPKELPANLVPGSPLNDRILALYADYGVIVYTDVENERMYRDLVSEEALRIANRMPADTAAAILYIDMIEDEFINKLPSNKLFLVPRNFYLFKNELISGTNPFFSNEYISKIWYNSNSDLTVGGLDNNSLDTIKLKQTFYYGLSDVLRSKPSNTSAFYQPFVDIKTDEATYYWQVGDLESAYEKGFLSNERNLIKSDQQDFDLYAAWIATTPAEKRDSILNVHPIIKRKYNLVSSMFRQEQIPLEEVAQEWQNSPYNPNNQ